MIDKFIEMEEQIVKYLQLVYPGVYSEKVSLRKNDSSLSIMGSEGYESDTYTEASHEEALATVPLDFFERFQEYYDAKVRCIEEDREKKRVENEKLWKESRRSQYNKLKEEFSEKA